MYKNKWHEPIKSMQPDWIIDTTFYALIFCFRLFFLSFFTLKFFKSEITQRYYVIFFFDFLSHAFRVSANDFGDFASAANRILFIRMHQQHERYIYSEPFNLQIDKK